MDRVMHRRGDRVLKRNQGKRGNLENPGTAGLHAVLSRLDSNASIEEIWKATDVVKKNNGKRYAMKSIFLTVKELHRPRSPLSNEMKWHYRSLARTLYQMFKPKKG